MLGKGGMGEVYLAEDTILRRKVALKILPVAKADQQDRIQRFEREALAVSALNHPNILTIHEVGHDESTNYIAVEFVDGQSLREHLGGGRLSWKEALDVGAQVASALEAAHKAGVVHRDIKPENIMVRTDGIVKVLDFGLAKLSAVGAGELTLDAGSTSPGQVMGTPSYMSPEQARGLMVDERTDLFSLGVVLYEMIEGRRPFDGETATDMLTAILRNEPPPMTQCPAEMQQIVDKALTKAPAERYQTAKDLLIDLKRCRHQATTQVAETAAEATTRRRYLAAAVVTLLGLSAAVVMRYQRSGTAIESLAVLPFANVSGDAELDYLSEGIRESLIDSVSQLPNLRTVAYSAVPRTLSKDADPGEVGRRLGVKAVLTGRVGQRGEMLSISVELLRTGDNSHVWGEQYSRRASDILAVQAEIVRDLSRRLRKTLSGPEGKRLAKRSTEDTEAYRNYLQGRYQQSKRTEAGLKKSISFFEQAILRDPNYALAYSGLADSYTYLSNHGFMAPQEAAPKARTAVAKALELDDELAEAHTALAYLRMDYDWDWRGAEASFQRAIDLNPAYPKAHSLYACVYSARKQPDMALVEINRAVTLEPLSIYDNVNVGWHLMMARRYEEAAEQLRRTLEMDPNEATGHHWLGLVLEQQGKLPTATEELQKAIVLSGDTASTNGALGHVDAMAGRKDEARKILWKLQSGFEKGYVSAYAVAIVKTGLGDLNGAFASLQRACDERDGILPIWVNVDPRLDPLRQDPRFEAILRRVGLAP